MSEISSFASRHLATVIDRPEREVYDYISDPRNLPTWATGLGGGDVQREVEQWSMTSPMGRVLISFVPDNPYGVLDHTVTLPTGESTLNPMRVIALDAGRCEVVFTLRRGSMSDQEFEEDARAVAGDLAELKSILEQA
ncbi:MAG TPA: SRPBCC family protein [Candidatus Brachybacterium merdavium]|uniref:SRPBCC family protein n=1 Tax=Candidatus Brachybacterium merdavium TaxID=2838513 RepID=A0A9D2RQS5_9MICO|nr:SRPBCC family protein [Candidatus Brachybacterium merdavium]